MHIFDDELKITGLADKIANNKSVAFYTHVSGLKDSDGNFVVANRTIDLGHYAKASLEDPDLYPTKSILCTTDWNKNNDVFLPAQTWAARHTAKHKKTDLEHNESKIVGHITDTWVIDDDGNVVAEDTTIDSLPNFFHIVNGAVIYLAWSDKELKARAKDLVTAIQNNEMYVSMEAKFANFSYALRTPDDDIHIIARTKDTAFLSQYLTVYGGFGEYEGCKLGRVLDDILFCGKGYVTKPANPHGIIFDNNTANASSKILSSSKIIFESTKENMFKKHNGVLISSTITQEKNTESYMSESVLQQKNLELEKTVASLQAEIANLSQASVNSKLQALEVSANEWKAKYEASDEVVANLKAKVEELTNANTTYASKLSEIETEKIAIATKLAEIEASAKASKRLSSLVAVGFTDDEAAQHVTTFASLDDNQFDVVVAKIKVLKSTTSPAPIAQASAATDDVTVDEAGEQVAKASDAVLSKLAGNDEAPMAIAAQSTINEAESIRSELVNAVKDRFFASKVKK